MASLYDDVDMLARLMSEPSHAYIDILVRQSTQARFVASVLQPALLLAVAGFFGRCEMAMNIGFCGRIWLCW